MCTDRYEIRAALLAAVFTITTLGCGRDDLPTSAARSPSFSASAAGLHAQSISGTIVLDQLGPPGGILFTPSGRCQFSDFDEFEHFTGDVAGPITFQIRVANTVCTGGRLIASGPFAGDVSWNGFSGAIAGQFETNCKPDASQPTGVSCDGTMNARGSGGLEGMEFHFKWGPGWYPFPYSGTVLSH